MAYEPDIYIPGADGRPLEGEALRRRVFGLPAEVAYPVDADGRPLPEPPPEADDERPPELPDQSGTFRAPE